MKILSNTSARFNQWRKPRSLSAKLLRPVAGLMLASLLISTLIFIFATNFTRDQIVKQQIKADLEQAITHLSARTEIVPAAAKILAVNPDLITSLATPKTGSSLQIVDSRAVLIRERFDLDLIQIYDASGQAWTNLVSSELYQVSSLVQYLPEAGTFIIENGNRLLLLHRIDINDGAGVVITGLDLKSELRRVTALSQLNADISLEMAGVIVTNRENDSQYTNPVEVPQKFSLAGTPALLKISRSTAEIDQVAWAGLRLMIISSLATTILLIGLVATTIRRVVAPVQQLAQISNTIAAQRQLDVKQDLLFFSSLQSSDPLGIGKDDEIGELAGAFQWMLEELHGLYNGLEEQVQARTKDLFMAAEVARAATSILDMDELLHTAVKLLYERFDLYFVAVFILEPEKNGVVLKAASGSVGLETRLKQGLVIPLEPESLIAQAIQTRQPVIIQDVSQSGQYLQLPDLPETQAEAVFPLVHGGTVVGVLDIESVATGVFTPEIVEAFTILAGQLTIAIRNAQLFDQQRQISQRLIEIDHVKTRFLNRISHELRTPLNAVIGFAKLMIMEIDGPVTPTQKADLESIRQNGQRLLLLINDLLDVSQIEAGQMTLDVQPVDLNQEIRRVIELTQAQIGERTLHVEVDMPEALPTIQADPRRIYQLLYNLVTNAIKFTPMGKVTISASYSSQWVVVNIADTGIGIPAEDLERIFHPFTQVDESTTRKYEGAGLGLTIVRYIVDLHGGKIWAESKPGAGSVISFVLPIHERLHARAQSMAAIAGIQPSIPAQIDLDLSSLQ